MIEIVYNKQEDVDIFSGISLPKNIRQIGTPSGDKRIYIEDYVMTYLGQLANPNSTFARGAILVGECVRGEYGEVIYVSGALAAQNLELDLEETTFDGETWSYIYQEVKTYFPDLEVVGWFLSRMGFSIDINDMIMKLHMDNFAGSNKVLYIMDALEGEDAFYMTQGNVLCKQSGYYIYYARNEAMQNFMITSKKEVEEEKQDLVEKKDEAVLHNYKKILAERAKHARAERMNRRLSGVCSGLVIAVLGLGIAVFSNYQMLERMESCLEEEGILAFHEIQSPIQKEKAMKKDAKNKDTEFAYSCNDSKLKSEIEGVKPEKRQYYTVQNGDTLSSISFKMYNSVGYVAELMEANGLGEADEIGEGDEIIIPIVH